MEQRWVDPYKVNENLENGVYQLENKEGDAENYCQLVLFKDIYIYICS